MSGYYLLGVEPLQDDLDGRQHDIEVTVSREGVRVRARREVVHRSDDEEETVQERLERLLTSPLAVPNLPLARRHLRLPGGGRQRQGPRAGGDGCGARSGRSRGDVRVQAGRSDGKTLASRAMGAQAAQGGSLVEQFAAFIVEPGQYS